MKLLLKMVETKKPTAPETPQEGLMTGLRRRLGELFSRNEEQEAPQTSSRATYLATPDPKDTLRSELEINGVKIDFKWNETYRRFQLTFPGLSPSSEQGNFIVATDNAKLAIPIAEHAKRLAQEGKSAQEVMDGADEFATSYLHEKLTQDDGRRPYEGSEEK